MFPLRSLPERWVKPERLTYWDLRQRRHIRFSVWESDMPYMLVGML